MSATRAQLLSFFYRPQGRIGRAEFALGAAFVYALSLALFSFALMQTTMEGAVVALIFLLSLPLTVSLLVLVAKRCHDMGLSGAFLLLLFIPIVGIGWLIALFFIPGSPGPNLYGPAPQFRGV